MTPLEIGHRVARELRSRAERAGVLRARPTPAPELSGALARTFSPWIRKPVRLQRRPTSRQRSASATAGSTSLSLRNVELGAPPRWKPRSEDRNRGAAPVRKTLDYRDSDLVGDIKYLWEPKRHLHS